MHDSLNVAIDCGCGRMEITLLQLKGLTMKLNQPTTTVLSSRTLALINHRSWPAAKDIGGQEPMQPRTIRGQAAVQPRTSSRTSSPMHGRPWCSVV